MLILAQQPTAPLVVLLRRLADLSTSRGLSDNISMPVARLAEWYSRIWQRRNRATPRIELVMASRRKSMNDDETVVKWPYI